MITLQTAQIWSSVDGAIATWDLSVEEETDTEGNVSSSVIVARYGEESQRFSPSFTDEELQRVISEYNAEQAN